jgi:hypothetical protein
MPKRSRIFGLRACGTCDKFMAEFGTDIIRHLSDRRQWPTLIRLFCLTASRSTGGAASAARQTSGPNGQFELCLFEPTSPFPGKRDFARRDNTSKRPQRCMSAVAEIKRLANTPANSAPAAANWEISANVGMRGGPGRSKITEPLSHDSARVRAQEPRCVANRISNGARTTFIAWAEKRGGRYICHAASP